MSILLDRSLPTQTVRILGQIPADTIGIQVSFMSQFDGSVMNVLNTPIQVGPWIDVTLPQTDVPQYGGQYEFEIFSDDAAFATLNEITLTLNEITASLNNIRLRPRLDIVNDLLAIVIGDDTIRVAENPIPTTTIENIIGLERAENPIQTQTEEYPVTVTKRTYTDIKTERSTYHK